MATTAGKILVDIVFNPDTKQLEKVVQDAEGKPIRQKIELDKGGLEGPLKDLKEFSARLADGGIGKGFAQLKEGFQSFKKLSSEGAGTASALAGGLSKIGVEGDAAFKLFAGGAAFAATSVVALSVAAFKLSSEIEQENLAFRAASISSAEYSSAIAGVARASEALVVQNAAMAAGLRLNATEAAAVVNQARNMGRVTGDSAAALQLHTAAAGGDANAMRALGMQVDDFASRTENARRALSSMQQQQQQGGNVDLTYEEEAEKAWHAIKSAIGFATKAIVDIVTPAEDAVQLMKDGEVAVRGWLGITTQLSEAELASTRQRQQATAVTLQTEQRALEVKKAASILAFQDAQRSIENMRVAAEGETLGSQRARNSRELLDVLGNISKVERITGGTIAEQEARAGNLNTLRSRATGLIQNQNRLSSFATVLADMQQQRLERRAVAEALGTRENVRQLTLAEQVNEATAYRNRLIQRARELGKALTQEQLNQAAAAQGFADSGNAQLAASAQQAAAARAQLNTAIETLRVETSIARLMGQRTTRAIEGYDLETRRSQLVRAIENFNMDGLRTDSQRNAALERRSQLVSQLATIEQGLAAAKEREGQQAAARQSRIAANRAASIAGFDADIRMRDRVYSAHQREISLFDQALQRQEQGLELTRAQQASLDGEQLATDRLVAAKAANAAAIAQLEIALTATNITDERRIQLRDMLIERKDRENQLELEGIQIKERAGRSDIQRDEEYMARSNNIIRRAGGLTSALASAAGGFKTFGQSATDLGTNVLGKVSDAFGSLVQSAIEGKTSFAEQAQAALKAMLASVSQEAAVNALKQTAMGFSLAANPATIALAPTAFAAAALWGGVAVAAGGASAAIPAPPTKDTTTTTKGFVGSSSESSKESESVGGPIIVNINTRLFDTAENVEDAIYDGVRSAERRRGRR
jgi:hypothetical protein